MSREFSLKDLGPCAYKFLRPAIVIPAFELIWGILTLCTAYIHNVTHLYIIRLLSGLFECVAFPGVIYCIGCWYKRDEIGKPQQAYNIANAQLDIGRRLALFYVAGPLGTMFSGYIQSAAYNNLAGVNGLAGWRWLFIM